MNDKNAKSLRSANWFNSPEPGETAIYIERFTNFGITRQELQSGRPIIGIAQSGSDVAPCNRIHMTLVDRIKDGIRDAGGVPLEFPTHPLQETCRRPTAALDRNLAYLSLVEMLAGYPFDGVALTTGCDKTTPSCLMAAATLNLPAIVLSGGPMLDSFVNGKLCGVGGVIWEGRRQMAAGEITGTQLIDNVLQGIPSAGYCNTMGTASSMNSLAEALGMSLPGCGTIPAPYAERAQMAYRTGTRIVEMVREDLTPEKILTREAFENSIVVTSAIGGSTNCPIHINAIARHMGVALNIRDWETVGEHVHLLANVQPAGKYLGEGFHRAGGISAIVGELMDAGKIRTNALTVSGKTIGENCANTRSKDHDVIRPYSDPLVRDAGMIVLSGNIFDSAVMKTSVISADFRRRYLSDPADPESFIASAIVFDGPEDYRSRIEDPALGVDEHSILVIRYCGPVGYPGSAEVVNMTPPGSLVQKGIRMLPCMGDGRQSGTSDSPSILNISPEAAVGGNLAIVQNGDRVRVSIRERSVNLLVPQEEIERRRSEMKPFKPENHTPWEEFYRANVGQLETGACLEFATKYRDVGRVVPRHSH
jgi:dihydroxy-acid dehydratase